MIRFSILALFTFISACLAATSNPSGWHFVQNGTTGVLALEMIVVSPTLAVIFDKTSNDKLMIDGHPAWGALWDMQTNTATPLDVLTDSFCGSGALLSNGTMVSVGGQPVLNPDLPYDKDGLMGIRYDKSLNHALVHLALAAPCLRIQKTHHLAVPRWYSAAIRIFDGSLIIVGGIHTSTPFYNNDSASSFEFFPAKDGGVPRPIFSLPDGKVFMVANNQSIIYDIEAESETILPDLPNGVRVTQSHGWFCDTPSIVSSRTMSPKFSFAVEVKRMIASPARITLTPAGIKRGLGRRTHVGRQNNARAGSTSQWSSLIINGAGTGFAAVASVADPVGNSNADHAVLTPTLYTPSAALGHRFSNKEMPTTDIARMYHSTVSLTPMGNFLLAGSNPNGNITMAADIKFKSELRAEYLNPPYMALNRPKLLQTPSKISFNTKFNIEVAIPGELKASTIQVALMDLGFSSHAFHSSSRLVFMDATLSHDRKTLTITSPPNNRVYPPGPGRSLLSVAKWLSLNDFSLDFRTIDGVTSTAAHVM
ncbi:glyoxal oxidase N-terminus-domain-containing protein, partial [Mycena floridula]